MDFVGAEVQITLEVNEENKTRITDQSRASIGSLSLLGEPIIEISPAAQGTPLKDGDFIQSARTPRADSPRSRRTPPQGLEQATALIKEIRAGKGTVGQAVHRRSDVQAR